MREEDLWRRLVDVAPAMMAYWDSELRCQALNRAYVEWFGEELPALRGRTMQALLGPELFAIKEPYVRGVLLGAPQTFERTLVSRDGITRQMLSHYQPDVQDGKVVGFVAQISEVTPLKEAQTRLLASVTELQTELSRRQSGPSSWDETRQRLATTLDTAGAGFIATDRQGAVVRLNAVAERLCGWAEAEALGRSIWEVFKREGRPLENEQLNPIDVMIRENVRASEARRVVAISRAGARTPVEVNAALIPDQAGQPIGIAVVLRDLSHQLRAEQAEAREQKRFREVVEAAPNGFLMVDGAQRVVLVNRKAEALFGYPREELIGMAVEQLVPGSARAKHPELVARFLSAPVAREMRDGREVGALRRDGSVVPVEIGLTPLEMPDGPYTLASVVDITARKAVEDELKRSNADLEQFAWVASHDLQEPLRMVASFTELLGQQYRGRLDEQADKYIHFAVDGARRMQQLVRDLLAYSRVGSQSRPLEAVSTRAVLKRALALLQPSLDAAGAALEYGELPDVLADEVQLSLVFQNFISNALKFRAARPLQLRISATREDDRWRFSFADNGIGFEPRYAERIFQMFQRLHERGKYEGSGIGLAIVKRIVERHGGRVWAEGQPDVGATFYFTLRAPPTSLGA